MKILSQKTEIIEIFEANIFMKQKAKKRFLKKFDDQTYFSKSRNPESKKYGNPKISSLKLKISKKITKIPGFKEQFGGGPDHPAPSNTIFYEILSPILSNFDFSWIGQKRLIFRNKHTKSAVFLDNSFLKRMRSKTSSKGRVFSLHGGPKKMNFSSFSQWQYFTF